MTASHVCIIYEVAAILASSETSLRMIIICENNAQMDDPRGPVIPNIGIGQAAVKIPKGQYDAFSSGEKDITDWIMGHL